MHFGSVVGTRNRRAARYDNTGVCTKAEVWISQVLSPAKDYSEAEMLIAARPVSEGGETFASLTSMHAVAVEAIIFARLLKEGVTQC